MELGPNGAVDVAAPLLDERAAVRAAVARLSPACCAAAATATQLKAENICGPDASVGPCKPPAESEGPPPFKCAEPLDVAIVLDKAACSPAKAADVAELVDVLLAPLALSRRGPKRARVGVVELGSLTLTLPRLLPLTLALTPNP